MECRFLRKTCLILPRLIYKSTANNITTNHSGKVSYKLLIIGGGTGGISIGSKLSAKLGKDNVAIVEPSDQHYYQPLWTLVGAGLKEFKDSARPTASVIPKQAKWIQNKVVSFDPFKNSVCTDDGKEIGYEFLVVAMGLSLDFKRITGLPEAFETPGVCSNYSSLTVNKTRSAIKSFKGGNAIFTQPINPIKCAGAPQKIVYLFEDYIKKADRKEKTNIIFNTALAAIFSVPKYAAALKSVIENKGIQVNCLHNLLEVDPLSKKAVFEVLTEKKNKVVFNYDLLHVTPPMTSPKALRESILADSTGFLNVDQFTLQHKNYSNVFGIGDCLNLPTSKTAAAISAQCGILFRNLNSAMKGKPLSSKYNGYTSCPITTGNNKVILAEFGYDLKLLETFPFDQSKERWLSFFLKAECMPLIYWNMLLKGYWEGPQTMRKILHLGFPR